MRCYFFAASLFIFIISYVHSNEIRREKRCLTCCGKPPCCNCCGLPGCGPRFNLTGIDLNIPSTTDKPTLPDLPSKPTRPTMCLMCCGKPPCCNTCGLDTNLS